MYKQILFLVAFLLPSTTLALTPNDDLVNELWYLGKVNAFEAWDVTTGDSEVIVAVLDAGIDTTHPDLQANIWQNTEEIPANGIDDDNNGYIDDVEGWDFVGNDYNPAPDTAAGDVGSASHGTLVAGIVGAVGDNGRGVTGVNWEVSIMPIRILDGEGSGVSSDAIKAIEYAVNNGAKVINLSFSGVTNDPKFGEAIRKAHNQGVLLVAAVGNEHVFINDEPAYPACYDENDGYWILGVAATDQSDRRADFSNYGDDCVDLSAPGEDIYGLFYGEEDYNGYWSGTSMAAPIVSGAAALLLAEYPGLTPNQIVTILKWSVDPIPAEEEQREHLGVGRLNIGKAFEVAQEMFQQVPEPDEQVEEGEDDQEEQVPITEIAPVVTAGNPTVYALEENTRRAFINATTYFTYFDTFNKVDSVSPETLSQRTLSGLVLPKPGVVLVKIQSDPRVYALENNPQDVYSPVLREIASESIAQAMYGQSWADYVIDIEPTFFTKFTKGARIDSPISVNRSIMKTRMQLAELTSQN